MREENASGSSSYPRASFGKRKWMCVCTAPSPIYMRDRFLLPCVMLRSGEPVLHSVTEDPPDQLALHFCGQHFVVSLCYQLIELLS